MEHQNLAKLVDSAIAALRAVRAAVQEFGVDESGLSDLTLLRLKIAQDSLGDVSDLLNWREK